MDVILMFLTILAWTTTIVSAILLFFAYRSTLTLIEEMQEIRGTPFTSREKDEIVRRVKFLKPILALVCSIVFLIAQALISALTAPQIFLVCGDFFIYKKTSRKRGLFRL